MRSIKKKSSRDPIFFCKSITPRKNGSSLSRGLKNSLNRNITRDLSLRKQQNHLFSESRSEMNIQELRVESANGSLRELKRKIRSHHMELYRANQLYENCRRERNWLQVELETRISRILQGKDKLKKLTSRQEQESQSTMNQITIQCKNYKTKSILEAFPRISMILRQQAALDDPAFPNILWSFRVLVEYSIASRFFLESWYSTPWCIMDKYFWTFICIEWTNSNLLWEYKNSDRYSLRICVSLSIERHQLRQVN